MSDAPTEPVEAADASVPEVPAEVPEQQPLAQQPASGSQEQPQDSTAPAPGSEDQPFWPEDWRERVAEHYAAGDRKIYEKELRRLERQTPEGVWGSYRALEARYDQGGMIQLPDEDSTDEEIAAYDAARGVPEDISGYFEDLELSNGAVIGDADMPLAEGFAEVAREAGMDPYQFQTALDWYFANQEQFANELDELDDRNRQANDQALREEFGGRRRGLENSVPMLFAQTPGGGDPNNDESFMNNLFGGRLADGTRVIDSPDFNRWVFSLTSELHPRATLVESGAESGKSIEEQLKEIRDFRRSNRHEYNRDEAMQQKERDLLDAQMKAQQRERSR